MDSELTEGDTDLEPVQSSACHAQQEDDDSGSEEGDIIPDAKFFQEVATEYQLTYQSLNEKYTHQAILVKEASEVLKASESGVTELQGEVMALKCAHETDFQQAVRQAVLQYEQRLTTEQSHTQEHQLTIAELQGQVQALQVSLSSQRDLPSVGATQEGVNLRDEVFNYVPGTVNTNQGAAVYDSPDQAFCSKSMFNLGTGLTSLIWNWMLLDQVYQHHNQHHLNYHHIHQHRSTDQVRCH